MYLREIMDSLNGNERRRAKVRIVIGTSIGLLIGAGVGIMLAPKSGRALRQDMINGAEWGVDKARETAHKAANFVKHEAATVNDAVAEKMDDINSSITLVEDASKASHEEEKKKAKD